MPKRKLTRINLCGVGIALAAFLLCQGCGTKEEPKAPSGSGYYSGDMKGKSIKGQTDTAPANAAPTGAQ